MCSFINVTGTPGSWFKNIYHGLYKNNNFASRHVLHMYLNYVECYLNSIKTTYTIIDVLGENNVVVISNTKQNILWCYSN